MEVLLEYKLSSRHGRKHYILTQRMGLIPMAVALVLFYAHGYKSGPGLWMAFGISAALQLILWSGYAIHHQAEGRSRLATSLVARSDDWFPRFQIVIQGCMVAVTLLIFWSTLVELGYQSIRLQLILIAAMLIILPLRRIRRLKLAEEPTAANDVAYFFLYYLHWILVTLFVATTLNILMFPEQSLSSENPANTLGIWIPTILIIIICIVLFTDHVLRKTPESEF